MPSLDLIPNVSSGHEYVLFGLTIAFVIASIVEWARR